MLNTVLNPHTHQGTLPEEEHWLKKDLKPLASFAKQYSQQQGKSVVVVQRAFSVREAVRTLVALDIVQVRHGHGMFVGQVSMRPMIESLVFRGLLKPGDDYRSLRDVVEVRTRPRSGDELRQDRARHGDVGAGAQRPRDRPERRSDVAREVSGADYGPFDDLRGCGKTPRRRDEWRRSRGDGAFGLSDVRQHSR